MKDVGFAGKLAGTFIRSNVAEGDEIGSSGVERLSDGTRIR